VKDFVVSENGSCRHSIED